MVKTYRVYISIFALLMALSFGISCGSKSTEGGNTAVEAEDLLPRDDDIQGWRRSGEIRTAVTYDELYDHINGGAVVYIDHGFEFYAGQLYIDLGGVELEVDVYDQGSAEQASELYRNPSLDPGVSRAVENLGEEGRVDEGGLFHYGVEFIADRFFVRIVIQDKTDDGLNTAMLFALQIAEDIP